jgi:hypothetical protein
LPWIWVIVWAEHVHAADQRVTAEGRVRLGRVREGALKEEFVEEKAGDVADDSFSTPTLLRGDLARLQRLG